MECVRDMDARVGAVCAVPTRGSTHLFAVAGANPRGGNTIKVLEYLPSTSEVLVASSMPSPGEGSVAFRAVASPGSKDGMVAAVEDPLTTEAEGDDLNVVLLRLLTLSAGEGGDEEGAASPDVLLRLSSGDAGSSFVRSARWKPVLDEDEDEDEDEDHGGEAGAASAAEEPAALPPLVTVAPDCVAVWAVEPGASAAALRASWSPPSPHRAAAAAFDPSAACRLVLAVGPDLYEWSPGSAGGGASRVVSGAHGGSRVLDVHCNPNRQRIAASAGEDGCVRVWDLKPAAADGVALQGPSAALLCLRGHGHWCTAVRFNPFHDQLLAGAGTDGGVCLWSAPSVSSAPLGAEDEDSAGAAGTGRAPADAALRRWAPHADAVPASCVAWSAGSAWVLCSASVEGRVAVREVPAEAKYKILLH